MRPGSNAAAPSTEGIKYSGSKLRLLPYILELVSGIGGIRSVLDGFSGTTRVSQALYRQGYAVTCNDISEWSWTFGQCYLKASKPLAYYKELVAHLNSIKGYDGWFTENYGGSGDDAKHPFQRHNTRKLDGIRDEIDRLGLGTEDKCVALTSLILALDSVDNTVGHYASYLSRWAPRAYKTMELKVPGICYDGAAPEATVLKKDIFDVLGDNTCDLAYFDPPYGSNNEKMPPSRIRYASYYHIWKTVILNDRPALFGKACRREDSRDKAGTSMFEEFRKDCATGHFVAMEAIDRLIRECRAHHVLLSYSSGGRVTKDELLEILSGRGRLLSVTGIDYRKNVMAKMQWTRKWAAADSSNFEYLFLLEK